MLMQETTDGRMAQSVITQVLSLYNIKEYKLNPPLKTFNQNQSKFKCYLSI